MQEQEIQQLVQRVKDGDRDAFGTLYDLFADRVHRYLYFRVDKDDAEDLMETVFVKAWEKIHQYKPGSSAFASWLFRIAHNLLVDHYRLNHSVEALTEEYQEYRSEYHPKITTERKVESDALRDGLKKLKDEYQQVLVLKYINGFSNQEVSEMLQKSEGGVRILQYRALRALRTVLEDMGFKGSS